MEARGAAADPLLRLGHDDVVGDLLLIAVPGPAPDEEHALLALHRHGGSRPVAPLDLQLIGLGRALLHRDLRLLARLDEVAADRHPVLARAHELVAQRGLDLAIEGRVVHEALDHLHAAFTHRDVDLDLRGEDFDSAVGVTLELRDPVDHPAQEVGVAELAIDDAAKERFQAH